MPTLFDRLRVGDRFESPPVSITPQHLDIVLTTGGYVHPLFADEEHAARSGFPGRPVPGEWTLLLLGGLAEQSGVLDDSVVALIGIDEVRFPSPVVIGDTLTLEMEVLGKVPRREGRGVLEMRWVGRVDGREVLTCRASLLCRVEGNRVRPSPADAPRGRR